MKYEIKRFNENELEEFDGKIVCVLDHVVSQKLNGWERNGAIATPRYKDTYQIVCLVEKKARRTE